MPQHISEAEFASWLKRITDLRASHTITETAPAALAVTGAAPDEAAPRLLHELSDEEWRQASSERWARSAVPRRPRTIADLFDDPSSRA